MYDSLLYGYGLNLAMSKRLACLPSLPTWQKQQLFFDSFFRAFITSEEHKRIYRDFLKYFKINQESAVLHRNTKAELASKVDEILSPGFENWVSKNLFSQPELVDINKKTYLYMLYNYWAHLVFTGILRASSAQDLLKEIAAKILPKVRNKKQIYTTNYDRFLDKYMYPQHLHGTFSLPLMNIWDIMLSEDSDGKHFEYVYLFGTCGYEKLSRLDKIRRLPQDKYNLEFFYNIHVDLGHLLVYGLSFANTKFIPENLMKKYPDHEPLLGTVDGHILLKLNERYGKAMLSKLTISYHTEQDLERFRCIFSMTDLKSVVDFKHSNEIFLI